MSIKTLKKQVELVLQKDTKTRNSDIALTIELWREFYGIRDEIKVSQLYDLPREDNIKRIRAKFQNEEKKYLPTDWTIAKKRGILRKEWELALGYSVTPRDQRIEEYRQEGHVKSIQDTLFNLPTKPAL